MPPKRTSAFMEFVHERRLTNPEGLDMSLREAVHRSGEIWKLKTQEERTPYILKAKSFNLQIRQHPDHPLGRMDLARREAEERREEMRSDTERIVLEAVENKNLQDENFVLVSFNYFTKTVSGNEYIPAEFAACLFSMKLGILSSYTTLINPGTIELGQASDALHHSSTTHRLPLPPNALGEGDFKELYKNIFGYLTSCMGCKPIVVFTKSVDLAMVKASLDQLQDKSSQRRREIKVLSVEYLLFYLKKQVLQIAGMPVHDLTRLQTDSYLEKDSFQFAPGIACEYHENIDRSRYCCKSCVTRWAFYFFDLLCDHFNIPKKPGRHIPKTPAADID